MNQTIIIQLFKKQYKAFYEIKFDTEMKTETPNRRPIDQVYLEIAVPLLVALVLVRRTILT